MDISRSEQVETDLDRLIERRDAQRRKTEGERLEEELWQVSVDRYNVRRREENRIAWSAYYRGIAGALYARAEEYIVRAQKLSQEAELGEGDRYLMPQCDAIKRDGGRCTVVVGPGQGHCYQHYPKRAEDRRRNASKGGKSKGNPRLAKLDRQLEDLAADALEGKVERGVAAVVNQIVNSRIRLLEVERKIKETEELETRLEALEDVLKRRSA